MNIEIDLTFTNIIGALVIVGGFISLPIIHDSNFAGVCLTVGSGLVGLAKAMNTSYDNNHVQN